MDDFGFEIQWEDLADFREGALGHIPRRMPYTADNSLERALVSIGALPAVLRALRDMRGAKVDMGPAAAIALATKVALEDATKTATDEARRRQNDRTKHQTEKAALQRSASLLRNENAALERELAALDAVREFTAPAPEFAGVRTTDPYGFSHKQARTAIDWLKANPTANARETSMRVLVLVGFHVPTSASDPFLRMAKDLVSRSNSSSRSRSGYGRPSGPALPLQVFLAEAERKWPAKAAPREEVVEELDVLDGLEID